MRVIECVPNISEGRDPDIVEAVVDAVRSTAGVALLDYSSDADHNRSVITYVGEPAAVRDATLALCAKAFELIDMRAHSGGHPRMGAVDVVPFIPLRGVSDEEAVELAREVARQIGGMGVPVYLYEAAATSPARVNLADVRRGEYEGLAAKLADPEWRPDAGPGDVNERSGAVAVGVRFPLIAFNVELDTTDLEVARRIANAVREKTGGYKHVKAMGLELAEKGRTQVSMNLVQYEGTPIHRVVETIRFEAARHGAAIVECELIGLAPLAAFEETLRHYLQMHSFSMEQVIETHLLGLGSGEGEDPPSASDVSRQTRPRH